MLRLVLYVLVYLGCSAYAAEGGTSGANGGEAAAPPSAAQLRVAPTNAGLSLSPFGVSLELSLTEPTLLPDARLSGTLGYDRSILTSPAAPHGVYGFVRYSGVPRASVAGELVPLEGAVQGGTWPHVTHLAGTRTAALGVKGFLSATLPVGVTAFSPSAEVALVQLDGADTLLLDGRGEMRVRAVQLDRWGYPVAGWQGAATGLWSASVAGPSLGLWGDGVTTVALGDAWWVNAELRAGYRPAWPLPIQASSDLAALGTVGARGSVGLPLELLPGLLRLERLTAEPRVRGWVDAHAHVGADVTLWLDTLVANTRPVAAGVTVGYANAPWVRLELRAAP